jgi:hypothetical protein
MSETHEQRSFSDHLFGQQLCAVYALVLGGAAQLVAKASLKHQLNMGDVGDELQYTNGIVLYCTRRGSSTILVLLPPLTDPNHVGLRLSRLSAFTGLSSRQGPPGLHRPNEMQY